MTGFVTSGLPVLTLSIRNEADLVLVRQRARLVAELLGFEPVDQTRVATAVSEIARNALVHGGGGTARFTVVGAPPAFRIDIEDRGAGVPQPAEPVVGARTGGGMFLARRLMDDFLITRSEAGRGVVRMSKRLPAWLGPVGPEEVRAVVDELMRRPPESLLEELYQQHHELLAVLEDLNGQQDALKASNAELEETNRGVLALYGEVTRELDDTNRGVMALYAQLDDQAEELRRVSAVKDRFLHHLSHEFRTPLNSSLALSRLLLDRVDGPLTSEQEVQVRFIRDGAEELLEMVNDLLDLAKIEAGRMELRVEEFDLADLIAGLRGMFRPLAAEAGLSFSVQEPERPVALHTDRGKLGRVLRNLLSNAIKYTEQGEVVLAADAEREEIVFTVSDTGPGIEPDELDVLFQDFVRSREDRLSAIEGTGLGLPLASELADMLGGSIGAESRLGEGSVFQVRMPRRLPAAAQVERPSGAPPPERRPARDSGVEPAERPRRRPEGPVVLVIDDDAASRYIVDRTMEPTGCRVVHAETAADGLRLARELRPAAIFLDLGLPDASGFDLLARLEEDERTADRPIIVYTSRPLDEEQERFLSGFALHVIHKSDPGLPRTLGSIGEALVTGEKEKP